MKTVTKHWEYRHSLDFDANIGTIGTLPPHVVSNRIDLKRYFSPRNDNTTANLCRRGAYQVALAALPKEHSISLPTQE